jgi:hypothetical protein
MRKEYILILTALLLAASVPARELHVAPDAPAGGDGSAANPLAGFANAVNAAASGDVVILHDGVYRERVEIRRDFPGEPLTIRAADGAHPILSGMDKITGWSLWKNGIYTNQVNFDARDLFVGSQRQRLARWPDVNDAWLQVSEVNSSGLMFTGAVPPVVTSTQMYLYVYASSINSLGFQPVTSVTDGQVVVPVSKQAQLAGWKPKRFILLNAPEFISQPGEWASESVAGGGTKLYFKPGSEADLERTSVRVRKELISFGHWKDIIGNVRISGLTFDGALGNAIVAGRIRNMTIEDCVFLNCGNDVRGIATGAGAGVSLRDCEQVTVRRSLAFLCNLGFGITTSSNIVIEACEAAFNDGDGIIINGGQNLSNPNQAFRMAENIRIQNCYLHHHIYQGHPDNMQFYRGLQNIEVLNLLGLYGGQQIMSEQAGAITISNSVFLGTGARHLICGKSGLLDYGWRIQRNTFAMARYTAFGTQAAGTSIDENIFLGAGAIGGYSIDMRDDKSKFTADRNLFASDPSSRLETPTKPDPAAGLSGQEKNSQSVTEARLANMPGFGATVEGMGVSTRSILTLPADQRSKTFVKGDLVEVNGDGIQRTVTEVSGLTITIEPPLPEAPFRESILFNWENNRNFHLDSRATDATPKVNGLTVGSSLDIAAYQRGDFDGDGKCDRPDLPASVKEVWPDPNTYVYPFNRP